MIGLVLAAMLQAGVPAATVITDPVWLRLPTGKDIAKAFPQAASRNYLTGFGTISCTIANDGVLTDCAVSTEGPEGGGFGAAALRLAPLFKMQPVSRSGAPVAGNTVRIPVRFMMPTGLRAAPIKVAKAEFKGTSIALNCRYQATSLDNCYADGSGANWSPPAYDFAKAMLEATGVPLGRRSSGRVVITVEFTP